MQLLDVPGRCWSDEVLKALNIDKNLLGKVHESCEATGTLLPDVAKELGLSEKCIVAGGAGDNAAAAVGTGVVKDGTAFTTIGTSGVVFAHTSKPAIDPKGRIHTCCCAVPGAWHMMGVTQAAGLSLKWFKDQFCQDYVKEAEAKGVDVYDQINQDVASVAPGSDRLLYLPYLMGERTPHLDPDCRGVFFGLSAIHTRKHLLRAVMEGVAYSLCDCNEILQEMGVKVDCMKACGGGGKSPVWRQMLADLYNCSVERVVQDEGPALGVAILAGVACGLYESVEKACDQLITRRDSTEPKAEDVAVYKLLDLVCGMLELPVYAYAAATQTYALQNHAAGKKAAVRSYEKAGIQLSGMIVLSVGMLCGIFQKEVFHWILSDEMIIARAGDYLWMIVLLVLVKIPYRIRLLYLQGIGKEGQVFWITAAASVIFGVGAFAASELLQLSGIYLMIILEYGLLGGIYRWQSKKV